MAVRKTKEEYTIAKQAILDHCVEEKTIKELVGLIGLCYGTISNITGRMVKLGFLSARYEKRPSKNLKGMVHEVMFFKSLKTDIFDYIEFEKQNELNGKLKMQSKQDEELPAWVTRPDWNSKHFKDLLNKQSKERREKELKSSRTYVGISTVYSG